MKTQSCHSKVSSEKGKKLLRMHIRRVEKKRGKNASSRINGEIVMNESDY